MSVDKFVLFGSPKDGLISPWQSAWFGVFAADSETDIEYMEERDVYINDTFGLKTMNEQGRIQMIDSGLSHLEYMVDKNFIQNVLYPELVMDYPQA